MLRADEGYEGVLIALSIIPPKPAEDTSGILPVASRLPNQPRTSIVSRLARTCLRDPIYLYTRSTVDRLSPRQKQTD